MKYVALLLGMVVIVLLGYVVMFFHPMHLVLNDGPYHGKVIDADTGAPIAEVVVLGIWYSNFPSPAGGMERYYDAQEVVTDTQGDFTMPGMGLRLLSTLGPPRLMLFKAGYEHMGAYWVSFTVDETLSKKIKWEGEKVIIPLQKLTLEERKKKGAPARPNIPIEKMQLLTREINKDRIERGLNPL